MTADLDHLEQWLQPGSRYIFSVTEVRDLVAELRLAREVVEEYRNTRFHLMRNGIITLPSATLAAYDAAQETSNG